MAQHSSASTDPPAPEAAQLLASDRRDDILKSSWADCRRLLEAVNVVRYRVTSTQTGDREELAATLQRVQVQRLGLELDLTGLDEDTLTTNASKRRLDTQWILDTGNLLLGQYNDVTLRVILPETSGIQLPLIRGSLYFSLVQRHGYLEIMTRRESEDTLVWQSFNGIVMRIADTDRLVEDIPETIALQRNHANWRPARKAVLFEEVVGNKIQDRTYLFSNTHATTEPGYFRLYQPAAAFPWLHDVVPSPKDRVARRVRGVFVDFVGDTIVEVLDNIPKHAFDLQNSAFEASWLGNRAITRDRSCMLVGLTEGGTGSHNRLYFTVLDNGLGIPRTMRWKHPVLWDVDAGQIIECILSARLKGRGIDGHVGGGLWYLCGLAGCSGGTVVITSEDNETGDAGGCSTAVRVVIEMSPFWSGEPPRCVVEKLNFPFRGTVVQLQARVPHFDDFDDARIEEFMDYCYKDRQVW